MPINQLSIYSLVLQIAKLQLKKNSFLSHFINTSDLEVKESLKIDISNIEIKSIRQQIIDAKQLDRKAHT